MAQTYVLKQQPTFQAWQLKDTGKGRNSLIRKVVDFLTENEVSLLAMRYTSSTLLLETHHGDEVSLSENHWLVYSEENGLSTHTDEEFNKLYVAATVQV